MVMLIVMDHTMSYTCCTYFSKEIVYDYKNKSMSNLHMHMNVFMICFQIYIQMEIRGVDLIRHLYIFPSYIGGVCLPLKSAASGFIRIYKLKAHIHTVCKKLFMHIFSIFFFLAFHHSFFSHSYHKDHSPSARKVFTTYSSHIIFECSTNVSKKHDDSFFVTEKTPI